MEQEMTSSIPPEVVKPKEGVSKLVIIPLTILTVLLGVATGFWFSKKSQSTVTPSSTGVVPQSAIVKGAEFGFQDASTFRDTAIGVLEKGGIDGEGTHKLIREGGPSQTVYLLSSVLELDQFVGKKIQVWGETNKGQKAAWLMDVGRVKILE